MMIYFDLFCFLFFFCVQFKRKGGSQVEKKARPTSAIDKTNNNNNNDNDDTDDNDDDNNNSSKELNKRDTISMDGEAVGNK